MGRIKGKRGIELPLLIVSQHLVRNVRYSVLYRARWKRKRIQLPAESPLIPLAGQSLFSTRPPSRVGIMESHGNVLRDSNDLFAWARAAINLKGNHTRAPRVHAYETCSPCLRVYIFLYDLSRSHSRSASSIVVKITISQLTGRSIIGPAVEFRGVLWMGAPVIDRAEFQSQCTLPRQTVGCNSVFLTTGRRTCILSA